MKTEKLPLELAGCWSRMILTKAVSEEHREWMLNLDGMRRVVRGEGGERMSIVIGEVLL